MHAAANTSVGQWRCQALVIWYSSLTPSLFSHFWFLLSCTTSNNCSERVTSSPEPDTNRVAADFTSQD